MPFISSSGSARWFWPPENIWWHVETFLVVMTQGCYWHLMVRGQRCSVSSSAQDSPRQRIVWFKKSAVLRLISPALQGQSLKAFWDVAVTGSIFQLRRVKTRWVKLLAGVAGLGLCLLCWRSPHVTDIQEGDGNTKSSWSRCCAVPGKALRISSLNPCSDTTVDFSSALWSRPSTVKTCNDFILIFVFRFRSFTCWQIYLMFHLCL